MAHMKLWAIMVSGPFAFQDFACIGFGAIRAIKGDIRSLDYSFYIPL